MELTAPSPLPLSLPLQGDLGLQEAASLFLPVPLDTWGSDLGYLLWADLMLRHAGVQFGYFLLSFRCSAYCCFKGRDLGTSLPPPCSIQSPHQLFLKLSLTSFFSAWTFRIDHLIFPFNHQHSQISHSTVLLINSPSII